MKRKMCETFNGTLGRFGSLFLNYDMIERNETALSRDEGMVRLQAEVERLAKLKKEVDKVFWGQARDLRDEAVKRIKLLTNEKYI